MEGGAGGGPSAAADAAAEGSAKKAPKPEVPMVAVQAKSLEASAGTTVLDVLPHLCALLLACRRRKQHMPCAGGAAQRPPLRCPHRLAEVLSARIAPNPWPGRTRWGRSTARARSSTLSLSSNPGLCCLFTVGVPRRRWRRSTGRAR